MTTTAELIWIPPRDGGRLRPPAGPTYSTVARFASQSEKYPEETWSLVVNFIKQPDDDGRHRVEVQFLVEEAPQNLLAPGETFELMEGSKVVAHGEVLSESD